MTPEERMNRMDERLSNIEKTQLQIKNIAMGIAIGLIVAAFIFGIITLKEAKDFIK